MKTIKLIRDRVPVDDSGRLVGHVHRDERMAYLFAKLHEETDEAREAWLSGGEGLESELADCWEALFALAEATEVGWPKLLHARQRKLLERGGFTPGPALPGALTALGSPRQDVGRFAPSSAPQPPQPAGAAGKNPGP